MQLDRNTFHGSHPLEAPKLLLVEDSEEDAALITEMLDVGPSAHQALYAHSLDAAHRMLESTEIEIILLDLNLPDGFGVQCVHDIRQKARNTPIVVLTGDENQPLALACLEAGAQDFIPKTELEEHGLRRSIGYALARSREARERRRADELHERLAAIVEASSDAIISCNSSGYILSWNHGAERIFGYEAEHTLGQHINTILQNPDKVSKPFLTSIDPDTNRAQHLVLATQKGTSIHVSLVHCLIPNVQEAKPGRAYICRDISESKRQEEQVAEQNRQLRARDENMRALTARLRAVREEEQTRMSREVHDELGQLLTGVKMDLRWLRRRLENRDPTDVTALLARLSEAEGLVNETIESMQRFAIELRPTALDSLGLSAAIRDEARRFENRSGITTRLMVIDWLHVSSETSTQLFRIFQELLTNVARHAEAQVVTIHLERNKHSCTLTVEDDGKGFNSEQVSERTSLGILGMHERAEAIGGRFGIEPLSTGGTRAWVQVPT